MEEEKKAKIDEIKERCRQGKLKTISGKGENQAEWMKHLLLLNLHRNLCQLLLLLLLLLKISGELEADLDLTKNMVVEGLSEPAKC